MKKILLALALMVSCVGFTSCEEDVDTTEGTVSNTPARDVAGTYSGTWTSKAGSTVKEYTGSITIAETDAPFVANVSVEISGANITGSCAANVVRTLKGTYIQSSASKVTSKSTPGVSGFVTTDNQVSFSFRNQSGFSTADFVFHGNK